MTPRTINTRQESVACDVCGRTLLRGEEADVYLAGGRRHQVCELCASRAAQAGWIREGVADSFESRRGGSGGGRSLLGRLRARRARAAREVSLPPLPDAGGGPGLEPEPEPDQGLDAPGLEPAPVALDPAAFDAIGAPLPAGQAAAAAPAATAVEQQERHVHAVPTGARQKMQRATELFNQSEHTRTIAGVARSLGPPAVAVRPSAEHPSVVELTVAWEISWYRYAVDLSDEHQPVQILDRGYELDELGPAERAENALADELGELRLADQPAQA